MATKQGTDKGKNSDEQVLQESKEFQEPDLQGALDDLKVLVQKPKKIPPEKVVAQGFNLIQTAIEQGYNFTEIVKVFGKHGVKISVKELKTQYELALKEQNSVGDEQAKDTSEDDEQEA